MEYVVALLLVVAACGGSYQPQEDAGTDAGVDAPAEASAPDAACARCDPATGNACDKTGIEAIAACTCCSDLTDAGRD